MRNARDREEECKTDAKRLSDPTTRIFSSSLTRAVETSILALTPLPGIRHGEEGRGRGARGGGGGEGGEGRMFFSARYLNQLTGVQLMPDARERASCVPGLSYDCVALPRGQVVSRALAELENLSADEELPKHVRHACKEACQALADGSIQLDVSRVPAASARWISSIEGDGSVDERIERLVRDLREQVEIFSTPLSPPPPPSSLPLLLLFLPPPSHTSSSSSSSSFTTTTSFSLSLLPHFLLLSLPPASAPLLL